jgi:hypothetical protein
VRSKGYERVGLGVYFVFGGYGEKGAWMRRWLSQGVRSMSEALANEGVKRGVKRALRGVQ